MDIEPEPERLEKSAYPGRGIAIGCTPDRKHTAQVYWIMGRSAGSRNRVFVEENGAVRTKAFDESKLENPSLVVYYPVRAVGGAHVVTNGDQTDTICEALKSGGAFETALNSRTFEPDPPIFTPRIAGIVDLDDSSNAYRLAILKAVAQNPDYATRHYFSYETPIPGIGHCITTYLDDGDPPSAFSGEPFCVELHNGIDETAEYYWNLLNEANRVALLVKFIDPATGEADLKIVNKYRQ